MCSTCRYDIRKICLKNHDKHTYYHIALYVAKFGLLRCKDNKNGEHWAPGMIQFFPFHLSLHICCSYVTLYSVQVHS